MRVQRFTIGLALALIAAAMFAVFYFNLYRVGQGSGRTVVVLLKTTNVRSDFWQGVKGGAAAAAKEAGAKLEVLGPLQETDTEAQLALLEEAMASGPDAIVVAPINDDRVVRLLGRIQAAGIELVVMDTPLRMARQPITVSGNHREAGRQAGRFASEHAADPARVAVLSDYEGSGVSAEREAGIKEALSPDGYAGTSYIGDSEDRAYEEAKELLARKPPVGAIMALNEPAALGAAKALKESNRTGMVRLIAFDSSIFLIKLLEDGSLDAMIVQRPFNMGYLGVINALWRLDRRGIDRETYIDTIVVTKDNMYSPENQKLLFPFK